MAPIKWVAYDTDIECSKPEKFGMYHGQPCLMLKLNKVYGWEPQPYYNITEVSRQLQTLTVRCSPLSSVESWRQQLLGSNLDIEGRTLRQSLLRLI